MTAAYILLGIAVLFFLIGFGSASYGIIRGRGLTRYLATHGKEDYAAKVYRIGYFKYINSDLNADEMELGYKRSLRWSTKMMIVAVIGCVTSTLLLVLVCLVVL